MIKEFSNYKKTVDNDLFLKIDSMDSIDCESVRYTTYISYRQMCAIERLANERQIKKSDMVRELITTALESVSPGILQDEMVIATAKKKIKDTIEGGTWKK